MLPTAILGVLVDYVVVQHAKLNIELLTLDVCLLLEKDLYIIRNDHFFSGFDSLDVVLDQDALLEL